MRFPLYIKTLTPSWHICEDQGSMIFLLSDNASSDGRGTLSGLLARLGFLTHTCRTGVKISIWGYHLSLKFRVSQHLDVEIEFKDHCSL